MRGMILGAGLGTRLRPLTNEVPKPLVPIGGRPLIDRAVEMLRLAGIDEIVVNLHHLPEKMKAELGDGASRGVKICYSEEPEILGPVGGILKTLDFFGDEPFVVVNGDVLIDMDLRAMIEAHKREFASLTMAVWGGAKNRDLHAIGCEPHSLRVRQIWKTPDWFGTPLKTGVNCGVYIYEPELLKDRFPNAAGAVLDFFKDAWPPFHENDDRIFAFDEVKNWSDIGTPEAYEQARAEAEAGKWPFPAKG